jgi:hypothetical protein
MEEPRKPIITATTSSPDNSTTIQGNEPFLPELIRETDSELRQMANKIINKLLINGNIFDNEEKRNLFDCFVDNYIKKLQELEEAMNDPYLIPSIGVLEEILYRHQLISNDLDLKIFINSIKSIRDEEKIIVQKKTPMKSKE